jgi:hypothetical protein
MSHFGWFMTTEADVEMENESGWLIEWGGFYWHGGDDFTAASHDAVRFSRQQDAEIILDRFPEAYRAKCRVAEHAW